MWNWVLRGMERAMRQCFHIDFQIYVFGSGLNNIEPELIVQSKVHCIPWTKPQVWLSILKILERTGPNWTSASLCETIHISLLSWVIVIQKGFMEKIKFYSRNLLIQRYNTPIVRTLLTWKKNLIPVNFTKYFPKKMHYIDIGWMIKMRFFQLLFPQCFIW